MATSRLQPTRWLQTLPLLGRQSPTCGSVKGIAFNEGGKFVTMPKRAKPDKSSKVPKISDMKPQLAMLM